MSDGRGDTGVVDERSHTFDRLVARDAERALIDGLLADARASRSSVLVLRGEAGVGKSALLNHAQQSASGMRILRAVGVEHEAGFAFAALHQLLRPVLPFVNRIPEAQAEALRTAMGLAPGVAENRFVTALAVLSLLAHVASEGPVLCVVDDAQWVDRSSADALAFVARRVQAEGIVMLFATRDGDPTSLRGDGLPELALAGLGPAEADALLTERFGDELALESRRAVVETALGLPLALLEIPAALTPAQRSGREPLPRPLPMGHQLGEMLLERVQRLPTPAQLLLLIAAAEGSREADVILRAGERLGISASSLLDAEALGLIHAEGRSLLFRHPILRSAVYDAASLPQRQAVHRALADVLEGEVNADRRAWHRAALVLYPDDGIADELERTADRARLRGGYAAASESLRRSAELTSSDEVRARRLTAAARAAWDAGRTDEAGVLLRAVGPGASPETFAEQRHVQGAIELECGSPLEGAHVLMDGADRVARTNPYKALEMLFDAAWCANFAGDIGTMVKAGRRAAALLVEREPEASLVELLSDVVAMLDAEDPADRARLTKTLDRVADSTEPRWLTWAGAAAALIGNRPLDQALRLRAESVARRNMAVGSLTMVLAGSAWSHMRHQRYAAAEDRAEEGLRLAVEMGLTNPACLHRSVLAWIAAVRGDEDTCVRLAELASETAASHGLAVHNALAVWAIAFLDLGLGRWESAAARLEAMWSSPAGAVHPYIARQASPDLVEAAVRAGRPELAASASARVVDGVRDGGPDDEMALAARCRALVASVPEDREAWLLEAVAFHERDPRPMHRARTLLLLGEHLRRERRRKEARAALQPALVTFEQLRALPWAERARRELRATGQTVRRRDDVVTTDLTLQERQVAALVAEGATNKEAAAQLFLSPRTVEYHLRGVFSKLGISSRAELARLQLVRDPTP